MPPEIPDYLARVAPGLVLLGGCAALLRRRAGTTAWIGLVIVGFVLVRDAMTPVGFWRLGTVDGVVPWIRFTDHQPTLLGLALATLASTVALLWWRTDLRRLVVWGPASPASLASGVAGGLLAAGPVLILSAWWPIDQRGGDVALALWPTLLVFAFVGNLTEEVLFRGLLQGRLAQAYDARRAVVLSAVAFAGCHVFLASTVTDAGWPLLLFTLYEGLICAFLRLRYGVTPAAIAHGLAIFLLATGVDLGLAYRPVG